MWTISVLFLLMIVPASVWAHPFTETTMPEQFSNAPEGTDRIIVIYSEAVEIDFSTIKVYDVRGLQIDKRDTAYHNDVNSLVVTTEPLREGVYTVTSKVLSRVDGHLVDYAFVFAIGGAKIDPTLLDGEFNTVLVYYPEAAAIIPGYIGQTVILGGIIMSFFVWSLYKRKIDDVKLTEKYRGRLMSFMGAGLIMVLVSNILVLAVHSFRLDVGAFDSLQTTFGTTWILRFFITLIMLGLWFVMEKKALFSRKSFVPMLILSLVLIATTTMTGHGTASNNVTAIFLDYIHNLLAAVWIGGIIFLAFCLFPTLYSIPKVAVATLPRFSVIFLVALGIVIVTGPTLLWILEDDLDTIVSSTYGMLIAIKITIASAMVMMGAYAQFFVQKNLRSSKWNGQLVYKKLQKSLHIEAILGCILLLVVALLVNGTLPAGEISAMKMDQGISYGLQTTEFAGDLRFEVNLFPFTSGSNIISASVTNLAGDPIEDLYKIKVKISNPQRGIAPITIEQNSDKTNNFEGEATFGFAGEWQLEVEAQRTSSANEVVTIFLNIKPRLDAIRADITEFELPKTSQPLYVIYSSNNDVWLSDPTAPRIWKFSTQNEEFFEYTLDGNSSITLEEDENGLIWFTDIKSSSIGSLDPKDSSVRTYILPKLYPLTQNNFPISLESYDGKIWVSVINKNVILKFDPTSESWEEFILPTENSGPFSLKADDDGRLWFTQQTAGQLGFIDIASGNITELDLGKNLLVPETITIGDDDTIWVAEHGESGGIAAYNHILGTLKQIPSPSSLALANSAVFDKYGNVWFAQHTVDSLAVYDPQSGAILTVPIPTNESWVQFAAAGIDGDIWFAEQKANKLGRVTISEGISSGPILQRQSEDNTIGLAIVAGPLMASGIVATSLFFVKAVREKRDADILLSKANYFKSA
ncbi:MAG: Copper resistance D domain-containing protein [Cenarchaeum symbiont of Oopsacas minuta]|nr:Copper resistance D domain-containing protein [Cenarchaeum symbiont of Oopsacas minuta]